MKKAACYLFAIVYVLLACWVAVAGYDVLDLAHSPGASIVMFFAIMLAVFSFAGTAMMLKIYAESA